MRRQGTVAFLALLGAAACGEEVRRTELVFYKSSEDPRGPRGFTCKEDGSLMSNRAVPPDGGPPAASLVLDLVPMNGMSDCRDSQLLDWCAESECAPKLDTRRCVDLPLAAEHDRADDLLEDILGSIDALEDSLEVPALPGTTIVRAVLTAQPCSDVLADPEFDCASLIGCVYSCPVTMSSIEDEIVLELDTLEVGSCEDEVYWCASSQMFRDPGCPSSSI